MNPWILIGLWFLFQLIGIVSIVRAVRKIVIENRKAEKSDKV